MTVRSPQALRQLLDRIMAGLSWADAMAGVGARSEGAGWQWKHQSKLAEAAGDFKSVFYLEWAGLPKEWFHVLCDVARDRRGALLATLKRMGDTCEIVDGRIAFQKDDFGLPVIDDLGLPVAERVAIVEPPTKGQHRPDADAVYEAMHPRRELNPSSYGGNKPKPVPAYVGSALGDYLAANKPTSAAPMTPLKRDLLDQLADIRANGPKNKPNAPVHVLGRGGNDDPKEHVSNSNDQTGLPTHAADVPRRVAPQPKPQPVDYSRRAPPVRLDAPGRG